MGVATFLRARQRLENKEEVITDVLQGESVSASSTGEGWEEGREEGLLIVEPVPGITAPVHICPLCGKICKLKVALIQHMKICKGLNHELKGLNHELLDY